MLEANSTILHVTFEMANCKMVTLFFILSLYAGENRMLKFCNLTPGGAILNNNVTSYCFIVSLHVFFARFVSMILQRQTVTMKNFRSDYESESEYKISTVRAMRMRPGRDVVTQAANS